MAGVLGRAFVQVFADLSKNLVDTATLKFLLDLARECQLEERREASAGALTPLTEVKVLILGQDPYHGPAQAQGLAFSVSPGTRVPPSLRNILKERARDLGPSVGPGPVDSLESWARQGVLLLNTCLSVEQGRPASHANQGWEVLTHSIVQALADSVQPRVFMLWGAHAQAFAGLISARHLVLTANHPSPLSASRPPQPFIGCGHFSAANAWLLGHQEKAIDW